MTLKIWQLEGVIHYQMMENDILVYEVYMINSCPIFFADMYEWYGKRQYVVADSLN